MVQVRWWSCLWGLWWAGLLSACQPTTTQPTLTPIIMPTMIPTAAATSTPESVPCSPPEEGSMRFLALGDSYTIGESVTEAERWPNQLADRLKAEGLAVEVTIIARTGWTTDELDAAIDQANPQGPYELVSLLIGVNNQYRGRDADEYRLEFRQLLERAITFAGGEPGRVIVLSIPDWGVTPFASGRDRAQIAQEIDTYNAINKTEAEMAGVAYVDVTPVSRQATFDPDLIATDGLHPSGKMYAEWAELAFAAACEALQ